MVDLILYGLDASIVGLGVAVGTSVGGTSVGGTSVGVDVGVTVSEGLGVIVGEGGGVNVDVGVNVGVKVGVVVGVSVGTLILSRIFLSAYPPLMLFMVSLTVISPCGTSLRSQL